jgi:hypothetical protein
LYYFEKRRKRKMPPLPGSTNDLRRIMNANGTEELRMKTSRRKMKSAPNQLSAACPQRDSGFSHIGARVW